MEPCKYEKELGSLLEAKDNFENFMGEMRDNHLKHIYDKLEAIGDRLASRRPSWTVCWIITGLTTLCGVLITVILKK